MAKKEALPKRASMAVTNKQKKYIVPEELADLRGKAFSLEQLRDIYVKFPAGGFRKAKKLAAEAEIAESRFWAEVVKLYPELRREHKQGKILRYYPIEREIEIIEKEDGSAK